MRAAAFVSIVAAYAFTSCSRYELPSKIVIKAEAAGAGNLSRTSFAAMQIWLENHRDVARDLDEMCATVRAGASAEWADSTEGKLCRAARGVTSAAFEPVESDHRRYQGGRK